MTFYRECNNMIGKNIKFNWFHLWDAEFYLTRVAMQDFTKNLTLRWQQSAFSNTFWSVIWPRIAETRILNLSGRIHEDDCAKREKKLSEIQKLFHIESNLSWKIDNLFDLDWETKYWEKRTTKVVVYRQIQVENDIASPIVEWDVQLVAPDPRIYDPLLVKVSWWLTQAWWSLLANVQATSNDDTSNGPINCLHEWDWEAPMRVNVKWFCINPRIIVQWDNNLLYALRINGNTTNLIVDTINTSWTANWDRLLITDNWIDIKFKRYEQRWWWWLFLWQNNITNSNSWISRVLVLANNYLDVKDDVTVDIEYRHTYSFG